MADNSNNHIINPIDARFQENKSEQPSDGFVAVDIGALSLLSDEPNKKTMRSMSRKGDTNCTGGHLAEEKQDAQIHVAVSKSDHVNGYAGSATSSPVGKFRRMNSRRLPAPWLNPRRVLFVFATLSSMGTLILLYFTLSMSKMTSEDADAR